MDNNTTVTKRPIEWRRAWTALKALIADPQRTDQVFEITDALAGNGFERAFQRFQRHPDGQALLRERPSLLETLSNRDALRALPAGSFGRAYVEFMESGNLTADGLVDAEKIAEARQPRHPVDADHEYFGDRVRDMHDLWHVLTGYGMDEAGEAANLAFTQAQVPNKGIGLIVIAGAAIGPRDITFQWQRYLFQAWRRGRRTPLLTVVPYERLLDRPLAEVRRSLRIPAANAAHPEGILAGNRIGDRTQWTMATVNR